MQDIHLIEEYYKKIMKNLDEYLPDGFFFINLDLLHHFDLLHFTPLEESKTHSSMKSTYHVIEAPEKITLIDDRFIIWILSQPQHSATYTIIALNQENQEPKLELGFTAAGIYNNSTLVIKVLEKFLVEIEETENLLEQIKNSP